MLRSAIKRWLLFGACFATAYASYAFYRAGAGDVLTETEAQWTRTDASSASEPLAHFTLIDQNGRPFDTASMDGRVWVASFFFTSCPAICVRLNQAIAGLQADNSDPDVHFVSITCDPDNDTPAILTEYARHFKADSARWTFLTGELETIKRIGFQQFQVGVNRGEHSDRTFAIDRSGRIRARYRVTEPDELEKLERLLKKLTAEPPPAAEKVVGEKVVAEKVVAEKVVAEKVVAEPSTSAASSAASEGTSP